MMKRLLLLAALVSLVTNVWADEPASRAAHADCTASWGDRVLEVGNSLFTRRYVSVGGVLRTQAWSLPNGTSWQAVETPLERAEPLQVTAAPARWSPVGSEGLRVQVVSAGVTNVLDLYPGLPGVIRSSPAATNELPRVHDTARDFRNLTPDARALNAALAAADTIRFAPHVHLRATSFTCLDQTDIRDNLLQVDERFLMNYDCAFSVATTAFDCQNVISGEGLVFVRIAPMPLSRPKNDDDFILDGNRGLAALPNGYPLAELIYAGGDAGRQRALIAFQRALRPYRPNRDGILLSNTWGAGNRDSRICQDFLLREIEAGARLGVDVIQVDDGWQHGRTQNSNKKLAAGQKKVWTGYWATDPAFWTEDRERFPEGLALLVRKAAEKGMRFGLWFGPDSSNDAAEWERDADCLLDYHRRLGIDYFKMDSMKLHTPLALARNRAMFDKMLRESDGAMVFDLDCTAEVRPGFFGLMDIGPLFVENRYTRRVVYYPHHTLKNLWDLAHVIDPVRLRFEFNNPDTNHDLYAGDPLSHACYRPDALFATVMTASPLAWLELSDISEKSMAALAPLVATWKRERAAWHGGVIHPVANRPDGVSWTGFVSESAEAKGGYVLLFRELNERATYTLDLAPIFGSRDFAVSILAGRGEAAPQTRQAALSVTIPERLDYLWLKLTPQ